MSNASNYFETAVCNVLRGQALSGITPYVALFDGDPGEDGTGANEVTATVRPAGRVAAGFGAPTDGAMANAATVDFGNADGAATVAGYGFFDAQSGGNFIAGKAIASQSISAGNPVSFAAGALTFSVA